MHASMCTSLCRQVRRRGGQGLRGTIISFPIQRHSLPGKWGVLQALYGESPTLPRVYLLDLRIESLPCNNLISMGKRFRGIHVATSLLFKPDHDSLIILWLRMRVIPSAHFLAGSNQEVWRLPSMFIQHQVGSDAVLQLCCHGCDHGLHSLSISLHVQAYSRGKRSMWKWLKQWE